MKDFERISKQESNENTALILMLGVLKEELMDIADLLTMSNNLLKQILLQIKGTKTEVPQEKKPMRLLSREDYID